MIFFFFRLKVWIFVLIFKGFDENTVNAGKQLLLMSNRKILIAVGVKVIQNLQYATAYVILNHKLPLKLNIILALELALG